MGVCSNFYITSVRGGETSVGHDCALVLSIEPNFRYNTVYPALTLARDFNGFLCVSVTSSAFLLFQRPFPTSCDRRDD